MGQDSNLLNFIIALVGVIGTGVGIVASLIPMELIGQRDSYQRLAKTWRLLLSEAQRIEHFCTDLAQSLEHAITMMSTGQAMPKKYMSRISLGGLQVILLSNSEFISQAPLLFLANCLMLITL
ncbi:MAG TPA: hypothetical protein VEL31_10530 [Ktedonobacteraceae bacterium]|nr:hypothetical protein [Ktedonobacteraceae bacterium]